MVQELPEGTVTVLFTDVEGSTELAATAGDAAARNLLRECEQVSRQEIERHDGREVKGLGDGLMVAFGSARRAVQCAVAMQRAFEERNLARPDEAVRFRIGLNTGEVIREQEDLFGSAVNAAARIESRAEAGQILASQAVKLVLGAGAGVEFIDRGEFRLKGFPERWRLYEVPWRRDPAGPAAFADRTPFVGRDEERARLRELLEEAASGRGAVVMLEGEPGIGKTRLTQEITAEAQARGFLTLTGHCYELAGTPPYAPFVEILETVARTVEPAALREMLGDDAPQAARLLPQFRQLFDDVPPAPELPPEQERRFLLDGMRNVFERAGAAQPTLLVLEDLHWADESTLALLRHMSERSARAPVMVICTYRDTEVAQSPELASTLDELTRRRLATRIPLDRLGEDGVIAMLRARTGQQPPDSLIPVLYRETEGNPFFVEEVFQFLHEEGRLFDATGRWLPDLEIGEEEVPDGVRLVIGRRLERLSEGCQRVLSFAAAVGREFSFDLLQDLVTMEEDPLLDAVDEAERANLVTSRALGGEARFTFVHEQIRQTLLAGLSLPRRQRLHLGVADAIERSAGAEPERHASEIAAHLQLAGGRADAGRTVRYLGLAGDQAMGAAAFADAYRLFDGALSLMEGDDTEEHAELLFKRGLASRNAGDWEQAEADWESALGAAERLEAAEFAGRICVEYTLTLAYARRPADVYAVAQRGLTALGDRTSAARARLLAFAAISGQDARVEDYETAHGRLTEAVRVAEAADDQAALGYVLAQKAHIYWRHMLMEDCAAEYERALEVQRAAGDLFALANSRTWHVLALIALGRLLEAKAASEGLEAYCEQVGDMGALFAARRARGFIDLPLTGDLARWNDFARADLELLGSLGSGFTGNSHCYIALGMFWEGRWDEAIPHAEQAAELELEDSWAGADHAALLLLHAHRGDGESARAVLDAARRNLPTPGQVNESGGWELLPAAIETLAVIGDRAEAFDLYPVALEATEDAAVIRYWTKTLPRTTAGIAAACGQQWDEAERHFEVALQQARDIPNKIEQPEVRRWYAWMLLDRDAPGDRERARELLDEAITMYREIGMPKHLEIAEAMLAGVPT